MTDHRRQTSPRVGAVNYLNSKPLVWGLQGEKSPVRLSFDLPSRLADALAADELDVALVPSIELFRHSDWSIVSDACVACRGPVLSVKLFFRVPPYQVQRLALDEGSRTSAALALVLLHTLCGQLPDTVPLPIGAEVDSVRADATLMIGDRAIRDLPQDFVEVWDLGERWCRWTELPFVFAMWVARPGVDLDAIAPVLSAARDEGLCQLEQIAATEGPRLGISTELATQYLGKNLHYTLAGRELLGLEHFRRRAADLGLIPDDSLELKGASFRDRSALSSLPF